jgi:hypothetical protein
MSVQSMELEFQSVVPDSIEPYVGFKYLRIDSSGLLMSGTNGLRWPHDGRVEATCALPKTRSWQAVTRGEDIVSDSTAMYWGPSGMESHPGPDMPQVVLPRGYQWSWDELPCDHESPHEICGCGIYVVDKPKDCSMYSGSASVLVEVALWGKVIRGDQGARGQYACIKRIIAPSDDSLVSAAEKAAEKYGVPLTRPGDAQMPAKVTKPSKGEVWRSIGLAANGVVIAFNIFAAQAFHTAPGLHAAGAAVNAFCLAVLWRGRS